MIVLDLPRNVPASCKISEFLSYDQIVNRIKIIAESVDQNKIDPVINISSNNDRFTIKLISKEGRHFGFCIVLLKDRTAHIRINNINEYLYNFKVSSQPELDKLTTIIDELFYSTVLEKISYAKTKMISATLTFLFSKNNLRGMKKFYFKVGKPHFWDKLTYDSKKYEPWIK